MTYAIQTRPSGSQILIEGTRSEIERLVGTDTDDPSTNNHRIVSTEYAHRWIRNGDLHETGLWLDEGRIRRS